MARRPDAQLDALQPIILKLYQSDRLSAREIARRSGVARGTVLRIIHDERPGAAERNARRIEEPGTPRPEAYCYRCHCLGPSPCVVCAARAWRRKRGLPP